MFRKNVAGQFIHFQGVDATTGGIKSGVTWTVRRCIDGTFAAGGGTVTEDGTTGFYKYAMAQADTNGNNIGFNFTGTGAVPQTVNIVTTAADPTDAVRMGLTALPNAAAEAAGGLYTRGTGAGQINQPANGQIDSNAVKLGGTTQTGRDIGASVLLSPGTGTGQVDLSSGKVLLQATQTGVTIPTVTTLTNAPSDSSGITTLLSRLSALRAGYLDNLSVGAVALESSLQALITTIGASAAGVAAAVWSAATRVLTAGTNIVLAKGTGVTGFNDLSAAQVNAEVDTALTDYDGPTHAEFTTELADADDAVLAAIVALDDALIVRRGTAQGVTPFTTNTIILDAGASSTYELYSSSIILIKAGTGAGQIRRIAGYDGTTKEALLNYVWAIIPDSTSEFVILADADVNNVGGNIQGSVMGSVAYVSGDGQTQIANRVWEDDNSLRTTADTAGNKLRQALILYEGN